MESSSEISMTSFSVGVRVMRRGIRRSRGRSAVLLLMAAAIVVAATACRGGEPPARSSGASASGASAPARDGFPRTVVDASGEAIAIAARPRRIVSQTLASDEILLAICPLDRIAGLSTLADDDAYSNVAEQARTHKIPLVSSAEDALQLTPDLVLVASYSRAEVIELLKASGAPVFRFASFERFDDLKRNVETLGRLIGEESAAAALATKMQARLDAVARRAAARGRRPTVLSYAGTGFTAGANTLFDDAIRRAGGVNLAATHGLKGFVQLSAEQVMAWQPDLIVSGAKGSEIDVTRARLLRDPALAETRAVKDGRLLIMDDRSYLAASQYAIDAVERLADAFDALPPAR